MTYVFYDTETTGTLTSFDQILQFGAIRTDQDLNELERFDIRCRLLPHVVPAPGALRVTGVTPSMLTDPALPSHFEAMRQIHEKLREWSPVVFLGYNSISFDENLLRQAFYQTLQPIYLTNTGGNARGDLMRIVHAASVYAPNVLAIPINENGRRTFRLDGLAPANGFAHDDAHEAISDVEATIHLSRLIRDYAPEVWDTMIGLTRKQGVVRFVEDHEVFAFSTVSGNRSNTWLVTGCGVNPAYDAENATFDLSFPPEEYIGLTVEELANAMGRKTTAFHTFRSNSQPILMPPELAEAAITETGLSSGDLEQRADLIQGDPDFRMRVGLALASRRKQPDPSPYVERKIYDGFPSHDDAEIMAHFHEANWEGRLEHCKSLGDRRLRELARRLVYIEDPDLLSKSVKSELDQWLSERLLTEDANVPWRTVPKAQQETDDLLRNAVGEERDLLVEVKAFLHGISDSLTPS
jgi:exodeoxyribonuclease I